MNFRLTGVIFGLVLLLVGGLLVSLLLDGGEAPTPDGLLDPLTRAGIKADAIDTVEVVRTQPTDEKLVFVKTGSKWELRQPATARVDSFVVDSLVRDLFRAAPTRHPELTASLGIHGLDKPTVRVTLSAGEKSATVSLGKTTIGGDRAVTFVTTGSAPDKPLAVKRGDLGGLFKEAARTKDGDAWELVRALPDFRPRRPLGADLGDPAADAKGVKVVGGGKELALTRGDAGWTFAAPANWGAADELGESAAGPSTAPFTGVRPLLASLTGLNVSPADYLDKPGDLAQYGLADASPERFRVELAGKDGPPDVLLLGKPQEKDGKPAVPTRVYAKYEGDPAVFTVPFDRLDTLKATLADPTPLRNRDLLPATAATSVDAIDLQVGGSLAKLRKVEGKWWLFGGPAPARAKDGDIQAMLAVLSKPRAATAVKSAPDDAAFAGPQAVAKFWANSTPGKSEPNQPPAEPTTKGDPLATLTVGRTDRLDVNVRRQAAGGTADLLAPTASVVSQVVRTRAALLDPAVTPFDVTKATKLTISRGADVTEATRDDKGAWTYAQPAAKKGQVADGPRTLTLLGTLGNPEPVAVASEAPTPDELKKWGLEPPALVATAALDTPEKERTVRFGGPAEGGLVYARVGASPLVLLVRKEGADELAAADLRDRTLFRLDPATVSALTLRGYKDGAGGPATYKFEKAGDQWKAVAPTPAGFTPDAGKLSQLLNVLSAVRAEKYLGAGNKPEYGLDPASNSDALEIGIDRAGGPPLTLVLGSKAADGAVYAASAALPGEVVTTRLRGSLDPLAARPANFQAAPPPPPPAAPTPATPKK